MGNACSHILQTAGVREYTDIARATCHSISAVRNYVEKFKRVAALSHSNFDLHTISFLTKVAIDVVSTYLKIYHEAEIIACRKEEIEDFLKKTLCETTEGGTDDRT